MLKFRDEVSLPYEKGAERVLERLGLAPSKTRPSHARNQPRARVFLGHTAPAEGAGEHGTTARLVVPTARPVHFLRHCIRSRDGSGSGAPGGGLMAGRRRRVYRPRSGPATGGQCGQRSALGAAGPPRSGADRRQRGVRLVDRRRRRGGPEFRRPRVRVAPHPRRPGDPRDHPHLRAELERHRVPWHGRSRDRLRGRQYGRWRGRHSPPRLGARRLAKTGRYAVQRRGRRRLRPGCHGAGGCASHGIAAHRREPRGPGAPSQRR